MFQRFHAMKEEREGGFTLIELLVVILIIAILAAIAIPVFLRQREKGWIGQAESALKNAAIAQDSYLSGDGNGNYATTEAQLSTEGYRATEGVTITSIDTDGGNEYCIQVSHENLDDDYFYHSETGKPESGTCPAVP